MTADEQIQLWRRPDGYWRWHYLLSTDGQAATRLLSHTEFASREEALHSAGEAYPGVPVEDLTNRRRRRWKATGCALALLVGAVVVVRARNRTGSAG